MVRTKRNNAERRTDFQKGGKSPKKGFYNTQTRSKSHFTQLVHYEGRGSEEVELGIPLQEGANQNLIIMKRGGGCLGERVIVRREKEVSENFTN